MSVPKWFNLVGTNLVDSLRVPQTTLKLFFYQHK